MQIKRDNKVVHQPKLELESDYRWLVQMLSLLIYQQV